MLDYSKKKGMLKLSFDKFFALMLTFGLMMAISCKEEVKPVDTVKPEADFTFTSDELVVTFVNTSKGADTYSWDFGNGETSTEMEPPVITYAEAGTYEVKLSVTRANGQADELSRLVTVRNTPVAGFTSAAVGLTVTFTNTSANADSYSWDFGDGSPLSTDASPEHTYAVAKSYTVKLVATSGALNDDISEEITVIAPIASFTFEVNNLDVTFTNTSENASSYVWDFGDGSPTSTDENPTHTYTESNQYTVTLTVTADDTATDEFSENVTVANLPVADYTFAGTGLAVTFTNASTDAVSYDWDFGDGTAASTDESPAHTFTDAGVYMVKLTATGGFGDTDVTRQWVTVAAAGSAYSAFKNGTFDDYGPNGSEGYQSNNDDWEKPDHWTGNSDFRAGGMSSDGKKLTDGTKTAGLKMKNNNTRGAYQEVTVEVGQSYTVTFDVAGDAVAATNVRLDAYVLSERIESETDPKLGTSAYEHFPVNDSELTGKGNFITKTTTFTATTETVTFYMLETAFTFDGDSEVWVDNVTLTRN